MRISWNRAARSVRGTLAKTGSLCTPTCNIRTGCVKHSPLASSKFRRARFGLSPAMSGAGSAPRAGNIPSIGWCFSRRGNCTGRSKWTCERSEAIQADEHARDNVSDAALALDKDGRFLGLRVKTLANVGAYISSERNLLASFSNVSTLTGVYDIPAAHVAVLAVMSNTNGTAPYRGAGRPEATYVIERLIDDAARELGFDRVELRAKNLIPPEKLPVKTALGLNYDCGDFPANQKSAMAEADWAGFPSRLADAK